MWPRRHPNPKNKHWSTENIQMFRLHFVLCDWFPLRIACVSAPSVYQKLKQGSVDGSDRVSAAVLEYDRRFATYGEDFIFYDYNEPLTLPASAAPRSFDIVLADPPYLSEECLSKVAQTVKYLSKGKVLLCTGET